MSSLSQTAGFHPSGRSKTKFHSLCHEFLSLTRTPTHCTLGLRSVPSRANKARDVTARKKYHDRGVAPDDPAIELHDILGRVGDKCCWDDLLLASMYSQFGVQSDY